MALLPKEWPETVVAIGTNDDEGQFTLLIVPGLPCDRR